MSFLSRTRFMARSLTRRASTWETISKVMPTSRRADFNATVAAFQKRKEKAADAVEDANIDFDSYKEVLGDAEVEAIRKEYEAYQYTDFEAEKKAELAQVQAALTSTIAAIEAQSASLTAAAAAASEELQQLERTRTTLETTLSDVVRRHPDLAADLEARIANEDWDTEAKPVDINALRMEAIEENWDAATLGTLDENSQKEFLDEIASLDAEAAADEDVEVPEAVGQFIAEWADLLGRPVDVPAMKAFVAANKLTDADKALTNERDIFREIEMATELGMFERAQGLMAHATALQKSGDIVTDEAWRATETKKLSVARSHQDYNNPVAPEELEGKSAEELSELANAAAANADYYGASQYMYASLVANGKIDTSATGLDTFAGLANALQRRSKAMAQ